MNGQIYTPPPVKRRRVGAFILIYCFGLALTMVGVILSHIVAAEWQGPLP